MNLNRRTRYSLNVQYFLGRAGVFILAPITFLVVKSLGYRIEDLRRVRESIRSIMDGHRGGWIICANHLTMIDSVIVAWALMSFSRYVVDFRSLPWNLPERNNFQKNAVLALLCYLTKCIPIHRGGDREEIRRTMEKCAHLLENGSNLLIFPEGGRSRLKTVDRQNFSYGVGRLAQKCTSARILCIYLRGIGQERYSTIPKRGERFVVLAEEFRHDVNERGLKGQREIARRIVDKLGSMENEWFDIVAGRKKRQAPAWIKRMVPNRLQSTGRNILET